MGFWDPTLWLPRDVDWHQLPPQFHELIIPIYLSIPLIVIRIFWESFVGVTCGHLLGYYGSDKTLLQNVFHHLLGGFAQNTRPKRILECFWRGSFYTAAFLYGLYTLWDKSWLWDVKDCWIGYPFHPVPNDVWWYYMIETAFYYSLLIAASFDVRRADFREMVIHHIVTIGLLSLSWTINFVRVGTLVLLSHDVSDVFLEDGKLVRYDRSLKNYTNIIFVFFLASWFVTRLGYYPFILIRSALFEAAGLIQDDYEVFDLTMVPYAPRALILLLCALLVLHVFWTVLITNVVYRTITEGEAGDVRSDSENEGREEPQQKDRKQVYTKKREVRTSEDSDSDTEELVKKPLNGTIANGTRRRIRKD